ncbi:hypothetical protein FA13DRAFT_1801980 [Coprinellus micaceus]|uniref:Uncharacterized protein n=1 Tax=Coprinellus micaceus TaxID=71717 RepID=A0A4Y7SD64_COPMI|nr:hypothetical protein FA13DRAFT_1801980 [Coprinellus micaceus]
MSTIPLSLCSKLLHIQQNLRSNSTGQLSAFAVISPVLGYLAHASTTMQEIGDPVVLLSFNLPFERRRGGEETVDVGKELREPGNGPSRRGGAAVASSTGVSPSVRGEEEDLDSTTTTSTLTPSSSAFTETEKAGAYGAEISTSTHASLYPEGLRKPPGRVGTPLATAGTPRGRRWGRKVD